MSDFDALTKNADTLARLHAAALASAASSAAQTPSYGASWPPEAFAGALQSPGVFAFLIGRGPELGRDAVEGFVLARVAGDEGEILQVAVLPAARRRGLARRLLSAVNAYAGALGARRLVLEVAEENLAALAFYRGLGFLQVGRRANYYAGADRSGAPTAPATGGGAAILALGVGPNKGNDQKA